VPRVLISGASGLIGTALIPALRQMGYSVVRLVRTPETGADVIPWDPHAQTVDAAALEGFDVVIHLAGENIAAGWWTEAKMTRVWNSRVVSTFFLSKTLAALKQPPMLLITPSGSGYYGDGGEAELDESAPLGRGFLAELCYAWEAATVPAAEARIRTVQLRIGFALSASGGMLSTLVPVFRWGGGGTLGDGRHMLGWIAMEDVVGAILHGINNAALRGPVNLVAPEPLSQKDFAKTLGRVLHRPVWFPVPRAALQLLYGRELTESMFWSQRLVPRKLLEHGYTFRQPDLEACLRSQLTG
jgi:uncharacterized protein